MVIEMKFTRSQIHKQAHISPFEFKTTLDMSELVDLPNDLIAIDPVEIEGNVTLSSNERYIFSYKLTGTMILPCARTLAEVKYPFEVNAQEFFSPHAEEDSEEIKPVDGEVLDLTPYIKENILLELPFRVFSDDKSEAKAPESGEGWAFVSEVEQVDKIDPRLKQLESFFKDRSKKE